VGEVVPTVLMGVNLGGRSEYPLRRFVQVIRALWYLLYVEGLAVVTVNN
jgi:hypothetical protein